MAHESVLRVLLMTSLAFSAVNGQGNVAVVLTEGWDSVYSRIKSEFKLC